jgi:hypothetical protein
MVLVHCEVVYLINIGNMSAMSPFTDYPIYTELYCSSSCIFLLIQWNTVKPAHEVTSIMQSPVLKGHLFLVLSWKISYELNLF